MDTYSALFRELQDKIRQLSDDELRQMRDFLAVEIAGRDHMSRYDPAHDPVLTGEGLVDDRVDLADRTEELLYGDEPHSAAHTETYQPTRR
jgi:hypothetical protein